MRDLKIKTLAHQRGLTLLEMIAVLTIIAAAMAVFAMIYFNANQQQRVSTLVNQVLQVRQEIETTYQGAPDFTGLSYTALLQENLIPPAWQIATSNTHGQTPFGNIGVGPEPYPGNAATSADFARISIVLNDAHACADLARALAQGSAQLYEAENATIIAPVVPANGQNRDMSALNTVQGTCASAIASYGIAILVYDFI